jgi:hypothetical protein
MIPLRKQILLLILGTIAATGQYALARPPEIDITGLGISIPDGDITPSTANDTDFQTNAVGSWVEHTFTISNADKSDPLTLDGSPTVQLTGDGDFTVTAQPVSTNLNQNETTTFTIRFTPTGSGTKTAAVSIPNNDSNENPYNYNIQGTVAAAASPPTVASPPTAANIQDTTATLGGEVTDTGGADVTERGIYWSTVNGFSDGDGTQVSSTGTWSSPESFSNSVTGLSESSIVYFKSFALNSEGTNYSSQLDFRTEPATQAAGVTFSNVETASMTVNWSSSGSGDGVIVVMKQDAAVDTDPTDGTEHTADAGYRLGEDLGSTNYVVFRAAGSSVNVTNLTPDTTYHVAVYAYAGSGPGLSGINYQQDGSATNSQQTLPVTAAPTVVSPPTAAAIEDTTATLGGEVTATNNATVTERGIYWSTSDGFTPPAEGAKVSSTGSWGTGAFSNSVTGLPASSLVYFRAFAENSAGTNYTAQAAFRTEPATQAAGVTFSSVGAYQMQINWSGSGSGDGVIVVMKRGNAVDVDPSDGSEHTADPAFGSGEDIGSTNYVVFRAAGSSVVVTNLLSDATYHVAVYAYAGSGTGIAGINYQQDGPALGSQKTLLVTAPPTVANPSADTIEDTTATLGGEVAATNNAAVTERGIYWSTSDGFNPPAEGTKVSSTGSWGTGAFSNNVTGLSESSLVYFRAFAENAAGTNYTAQASFRTEPSAQVSGLSITNVSHGGMRISWSDSGSGDGVLVVMKKNTAVDSAPSDGTEHAADDRFGLGDQLGSGNYVLFRAAGTSVVATNLEAETTYHVAAYAYTGTGTGIAGINYQQDGPDTRFATTLTAPITITPPAVANTTPTLIEATTAALGGNVTATNGAAITERGIYWSTTDGFAPPGQGTKVSSTGSWGTGPFSENVTGLNQGSLIYYRAFAVNSSGTTYTAQTVFQTEPSVQASAPIFSSINDTSATLQWTSGNGDGTLVIAKWLEPTSEPPADGTEHFADPAFTDRTENYSDLPSNIGSDNFAVYRASGTSVTLTDLAPNSTYYVSLYEYAGTGTGLAGVNYQQDAPASNNVNTLIGLTWMGHNRKYGIIDCNTCHGTHFGFGVPHDEEQQSTTCGQCHNPTGVASNKFEVSLHYDSVSNVLADCGDCHEVHRALPGSGDLAEMVTFDDHTATTGTNLFYFRADTKAHPQAIGSGVFHDTGSSTEDYAFTNAAPYNGACQVCHTNTDHHTNTGLDLGHGDGNACSDCHVHEEAFQGAGGSDCTACHANTAGGHRAVMPDFGLIAGHIPGGAVTTNDCMTCHHEEFGNAYHGNTTTDLRNVDDDSVVSIAQPFNRDTNSVILEVDVVNLQNNFCLKCHDVDGANGNTTPFSTGNSVPDIHTALQTTNAYFHPVLGPGSNPKCNSTTMEQPWNQGANEHNVISCFDCHGLNAHGSTNNNMLLVHISGPTDGENIAAFCSRCHDVRETKPHSSNAAHMDPTHFEDYGSKQAPDVHGPFSCRGCHSGQEEPDEDGDRTNTVNIITLASAALDIHGGNYQWPTNSPVGELSTTKHFINGGWLEGWDPAGDCSPDGNCQHASQSYTP